MKAQAAPPAHRLPTRIRASRRLGPRMGRTGIVLHNGAIAPAARDSSDNLRFVCAVRFLHVDAAILLALELVRSGELLVRVLWSADSSNLWFDDLGKREFHMALASMTLVMALASMTFTNGGNNLIYSDNPEAFSVSPDDLHYQWGVSLSTAFKDVEMYHVLYNGWGAGSQKQIRAGVAIRNSNSSPVTITYKGASDSYDVGTANSVDRTPTVLRNFFNASPQTLTIPAWGTAFVYGHTTRFDGVHSKFVFVRAQFKSSLSSNVWMRVFVAGENKLSSVNDLFSIASPVAGSSPSFTGELSYNQKNVSLSANSTNTYKFCEHPQSLNYQEYTGVISYKTGGSSKSWNAGNYGVIYRISISNANAKTIRIRPDWSISGRTSASVVYRVNGGPWTTPGTIGTGSSWVTFLGTGSNATFEFVLPGGNFGNYIINFE